MKRRARGVAGGKGLACGRQAFKYQFYFATSCCSLHRPITVDTSCRIFSGYLTNYLNI